MNCLFYVLILLLIYFVFQDLGGRQIEGTGREDVLRREGRTHGNSDGRLGRSCTLTPPPALGNAISDEKCGWSQWLIKVGNDGPVSNKEGVRL